MEDLIYYSPKHYKIFSQVLRDLFDSLHSSVLFFMNFTLAESEESTIELILGGAVWSRITKKIRYKQFTEKNAFDYCNELLTRSKIDSTISKPIDNVTINKVIKLITIGNLTPREINKHFKSLFDYASDNGVNQIDENLVNRYMAEKFEQVTNRELTINA